MMSYFGIMHWSCLCVLTCWNTQTNKRRRLDLKKYSLNVSRYLSPPLPPRLPLQNKLWPYRQHYRKLNRLYISRCVYSAHLDDWSAKILSRHATSLRHQSMEASSILFIQTAAVQYYFCLIVDAWEFMWESYSSMVKFSDGVCPQKTRVSW